MLDRSASGKKENINIVGGTVSGTNRNRPWDKPAFFLFNSTVKLPFCPLVPCNAFGSVPGMIREGVNREKLTVKKLIDNEMFFFHRLCPLQTVKNRRKP